jgi:hypothetical protein
MMMQRLGCWSNSQRNLSGLLLFDEGGSRYGIMTTNISEVFNFVLKGIALCRFLESWITLFTSVMSTSLIGGRKPSSLWQKKSIGGNLPENTFSE